MRETLDWLGGRLSGLFARPSWRDLADMTIAGVAFGALALVMGRELFTPGLLAPSAFASMMLLAIFVPALAEELVFRGLLIPNDGTRRMIMLAASTGLFVLWHVVEALTFLPGAEALFLRADFLILAAGLGLACGILRMRSSSLWSAIALHWLAVVVWKGCLGGPSLAALAEHG